MKRILSVCLSLLFLLTALPLGAIPVFAATSGTTGDCTWTLDDNGHLTISGNGAMGWSYWDCGPWGEDVTSVTIEDGVTTIGNDAFTGCTSLESVTIPASVKKIGYAAFSGCTALESVYLSDIAAWCDVNFQGEWDHSGENYYRVPWSNPLYYAEHLYINGELVTDLVIPNSVETLPPYIFAGKALTSVTLGQGVKTIEDYALQP